MRRALRRRCAVAAVMALVSADSRIAELLAELQRLLGHTQVRGRGRGRGRLEGPEPLWFLARSVRVALEAV